MDRAERIKGYADRAPRADVLWLIAEVERWRGLAWKLEAELRDFQTLYDENEAELARLRGEVAPPRCPCGFPTDHAGWCPKR